MPGSARAAARRRWKATRASRRSTCPAPTGCEHVPVLGPLYADVISGHNILVYVAFAARAADLVGARRTRFGLRLRAVGENPAAVDTAGISVTALRYARGGDLAASSAGSAGAYLVARAGGGLRAAT